MGARSLLLHDKGCVSELVYMECWVYIYVHVCACVIERVYVWFVMEFVLLDLATVYYTY